MGEFDELQFSWIDDYFNNHIDALRDQIFLVEEHGAEARLLRRQMRDLQTLSDLYEQYKDPFTREANILIWAKFSEILALIEGERDLWDIASEIEWMIDNELDRLSDTINPFTEMTPRDIVEKNVDFYSSIEHWWGVYFEWLLESDINEKFYRLFTIEYLNVISEHDSTIDEQLQCSKSEVLSIMTRVKQRLSEDELAQLGYVFRFQTLEWEYDLSFYDIFTPQESYELWEMRSFLERWIDIMNFEWHLSLQNVQELFWEWVISRDDAFRVLEGEEWFQEDKNPVIDSDTGRERWYNLSDALVEFGFSENFLISMREITWRDMDEKYQERLLLMTRFFLRIESRWWYNITHDTWASSAEWYLQYVHKNGRLRIDRNEENQVIWYEWLTNSFETWLRKLPDQLLVRHEWLGEAVQESWVHLRMLEWESIDAFELRAIQNQNNQSPISLSAEEQLLLTFNDLYSRESTQDYFTILFESNDNFSIEQAIVDLYMYEHHAGINTPAWLDEATKRVITQTATNMFWYWEWMVLFSQRPLARSDRTTPEEDNGVDSEAIDTVLESLQWDEW